jgi:hypothetical protein
MVIEEMIGGQHQVHERDGWATQKLQRHTQFVRRRRGAFDFQ